MDWKSISRTDNTLACKNHECFKKNVNIAATLKMSGWGKLWDYPPRPPLENL